ncbi:hypothetical protein M409DRAFT_16929 [Zasmidium cellare ATCC 36951]|uniref:Uncharacterized protein n=1 Tax=Zasmidium cellare ATCC 36951 TaxID=1080233 RepID=A0A6A6D3F1_ZASCE|nr:uncharacterized protein M409DRAFT_16929 [Zasmidium cellare ATCC 36951]KAF2172978.1 hypothetical protein M409DRAFT_16929 [Zasmidium cellare ATCC 36951]
MTDPSLAPRQHDQGFTEGHASDPFATPTLNPADLPTPPEPVAQISSRSQSALPVATSSSPNGRPHHEKAPYSYKSASMSSSGESSMMTGISSIDLEKGALGREQIQNKKKHTRRDRQSRDRHSKERRDPEKAAHSRSPGSHDRQPGRDPERVAYLEDDELDEARQLQEEKAVKILLYLSGPCVVMSFLNAIWTFISLIITSLAQPVRLCARRPTFGQQLGGLLGPAFNLQLKSIYTPLPPHADEDSSYRTGMLLTVQLLSPFLSLGMMVAAWVVAVFWGASAVVGDPSGTDKRDDGRETVMALRNWWEKWLVRSMREE